MSQITGVVEFKLNGSPLTVDETMEFNPTQFEKTQKVGMSNKKNRQKKIAVEKITVSVQMDDNYDHDVIANTQSGVISIVQDNGRKSTMNDAEVEGVISENHADGVASIEFTGTFVENSPIS